MLSHLRQTAGIRRDHAGDRLRVGEVLEDLVRLRMRLESGPRRLLRWGARRGSRAQVRAQVRSQVVRAQVRAVLVDRLAVATHADELERSEGRRLHRLRLDHSHRHAHHWSHAHRHRRGGRLHLKGGVGGIRARHVGSEPEHLAARPSTANETPGRSGEEPRSVTYGRYDGTITIYHLAV